jgi:hypothetical protein
VHTEYEPMSPVTTLYFYEAKRQVIFKKYHSSEHSFYCKRYSEISSPRNVICCFLIVSERTSWLRLVYLVWSFYIPNPCNKQTNSYSCYSTFSLSVSIELFQRAAVTQLSPIKHWHFAFCVFIQQLVCGAIHLPADRNVKASRVSVKAVAMVTGEVV